MNTRICIIGGSGFVGRAIVRLAIEQGCAVTVACRHPERARDMLVRGVRLVRANVTDGRGLDEATRDADVVINLVGLMFEHGRQNFVAAHVHGTERVLAACANAGIRQYLHMSALGAGRIPASSYARTKGEAETRVRQSGLDWTIFRPSVIYGRNDSFFGRFRNISKRSPVVPVIAGGTRFQPVWVEDVARAFVMAVRNRHVSGRTFELGGPYAYALREIIAMLMTTLGRRRLLVPVPDAFAAIIALLGRLLPTPPLTRDQLILLKHDSIIDGEPFPSLFGAPAALEDILPGLVAADQPTRLQRRLDANRIRHLHRH
jgi:uncharacterized protein YbjT (DUF2867 family)